jgi:nicotinamide-nucleotide amidase
VSDLEVAKSVVKKLSKIRKSLSVAESITGGGLASALTDIPGASKVFIGGVIAYSDQVKINELSISKADLLKYGAVSEEIALAMAQGCLKKFKTDYALATTGVAGPGSDNGVKAGTAWVGVAGKGESFAIALSLSGTREIIRHATITSALAALERTLKP